MRFVKAANTKKATGWVVGVFISWRSERNERGGTEKCPEKLLEEPNAEQLNYRFVVEVRRIDQRPYPATSIAFH